MINVVNKRRHKATPNDIYIGRGSPLGNPFTHRPLSGTKASFKVDSVIAAIMAYKDYIGKELEENEEIIGVFEEIKRKHREGEVNLVCYCKPGPCHGDVVKAIILEDCGLDLP